MDLYKSARYDFERATKMAKAKYRDSLEDKLKAGDIRGVWQGLHTITGSKKKQSVQDVDPLLPDQLNKFYCRFDVQSWTGQWEGLTI